MSAPTILLDPGHGGPRNRGTRGPGLVECDYVLELCLWLQVRAQHHGAPYTVAVTRRSDEHLSLDARAQIAADVGASAAIVVHVNAGPPQLGGMETYVWPGDFAAASIAHAIMLAAPMPFFHRHRRPWSADEPSGPDDSWRQRPRNVLAPYARRRIPAVLVELGYRTRPEDLAALLSMPGQLGLAVAIEAGMCEVLRLEL